MKKNGPDGLIQGGTAALPYLPLRNRVLFPGTRGEFIIGRSNSLQALETALEHNAGKVFVTLQKDADLLNPDAAKDLYATGTVCRISRNDSPDQPEKTPVTVELTCLYRAGALSWDEGTVTVKRLTETAIPEEEIEQIQLDFRLILKEILPDEASDLLPKLTSALRSGRIFQLIHRLSTVFHYSAEELQMLMEPDADLERLIRALSLAGPSQRLDHLEKHFTRKVRSRLDNLQTEFMLKEKLKQVQRELGKAESQDPAEELREQAARVNLSPEAREKFEREILRLQRIPEMSPESGTTRSYLEWLLALPWGICPDEETDLKKIEQALHATHYGMNDVKDRILEFTAARLLAGPHARGSIICLVGPPGTGKTSLGHSIAVALQRKFVRMSLGGVRDETEIRGHRRTYVNSMPGRIIQHLRKAGTANPVFLLDEIDKLGSDFHGDPSSALLEVLDPEINHGFIDHFLEVEFDLSKILFITTANAVHTIPEPLRDRMEIIEISGYTRHEKIEIAAQHLFPKQLRRNGLSRENITAKKEIFDKVIDEYTREAGVRMLEKQLEKICRKTARELLTGRKKRFPLDAERVTRLLGVSRYRIKDIRKESTVGLARGLAWTAAGGELLYIEARALPGSGRLHLTGKLGEVMKESAQAARSYARELLHTRKIPLPAGEIATLDIHVHVPAGAIPKDGPSAGATIAVAIISALFHRPVNAAIAMTGEISLLGEILPVGGLKEKVLAAKRNGIFQILVPDENRPDIEELAAEVTEGITFHYMETMDQVLSHTIPGLLDTTGTDTPGPSVAEEQ